MRMSCNLIADENDILVVNVHYLTRISVIERKQSVFGSISHNIESILHIIMTADHLNIVSG